MADSHILFIPADESKLLTPDFTEADHTSIPNHEVISHLQRHLMQQNKEQETMEQETYLPEVRAESLAQSANDIMLSGTKQDIKKNNIFKSETEKISTSEYNISSAVPSNTEKASIDKDKLLESEVKKWSNSPEYPTLSENELEESLLNDTFSKYAENLQTEVEQTLSKKRKRKAKNRPIRREDVEILNKKRPKKRSANEAWLQNKEEQTNSSSKRIRFAKTDITEKKISSQGMGTKHTSSKKAESTSKKSVYKEPSLSVKHEEVRNIPASTRGINLNKFVLKKKNSVAFDAVSKVSKKRATKRSLREETMSQVEWKLETVSETKKIKYLKHVNSSESINQDKEEDSVSKNNIGRKSKRRQVDATNPRFHEPFKYGWKREIVYRSNTNSATADVYYYSPSGVKLRSMSKVKGYLTGAELTVENFTFNKASVGVNDPDKEFIRTSKGKKSKVGVSTKNLPRKTHKMRGAQNESPVTTNEGEVRTCLVDRLIGYDSVQACDAMSMNNESNVYNYPEVASMISESRIENSSETKHNTDEHILKNIDRSKEITDQLWLNADLDRENPTSIPNMLTNKIPNDTQIPNSMSISHQIVKSLPTVEFQNLYEKVHQKTKTMYEETKSSEILDLSKNVFKQSPKKVEVLCNTSDVEYYPDNVKYKSVEITGIDNEVRITSLKGRDVEIRHLQNARCDIVNYAEINDSNFSEKTSDDEGTSIADESTNSLNKITEYLSNEVLDKKRVSIDNNIENNTGINEELGSTVKETVNEHIDLAAMHEIISHDSICNKVTTLNDFQNVLDITTNIEKETKNDNILPADNSTCNQPETSITSIMAKEDSNAGESSSTDLDTTKSITDESLERSFQECNANDQNQSNSIIPTNKLSAVSAQIDLEVSKSPKDRENRFHQCNSSQVRLGPEYDSTIYPSTLRAYNFENMTVTPDSVFRETMPSISHVCPTRVTQSSNQNGLIDNHDNNDHVLTSTCSSSSTTRTEINEIILSTDTGFKCSESNSPSDNTFTSYESSSDVNRSTNSQDSSNRSQSIISILNRTPCISSAITINRNENITISTGTINKDNTSCNTDNNGFCTANTRDATESFISASINHLESFTCTSTTTRESVGSIERDNAKDSIENKEVVVAGKFLEMIQLPKYMDTNLLEHNVTTPVIREMSLNTNLTAVTSSIDTVNSNESNQTESQCSDLQIVRNDVDAHSHSKAVILKTDETVKYSENKVLDESARENKILSDDSSCKLNVSSNPNICINISEIEDNRISIQIMNQNAVQSHIIQKDSSHAANIIREIEVNSNSIESTTNKSSETNIYNLTILSNNISSLCQGTITSSAESVKVMDPLDTDYETFKLHLTKNQNSIVTSNDLTALPKLDSFPHPLNQQCCTSTQHSPPSTSELNLGQHATLQMMENMSNRNIETIGSLPENILDSEYAFKCTSLEIQELNQVLGSSVDLSEESNLRKIIHTSSLECDFKNTGDINEPYKSAPVCKNEIEACSSKEVSKQIDTNLEIS